MADSDSPRHRPATGRSSVFQEIAERSQQILDDWLILNPPQQRDASALVAMGGIFRDLTSRMMALPAHVMSAQVSLWYDYLLAWQDTTWRLWGGETVPTPAVVPATSHSPSEWTAEDGLDFVARAFLFTANWLAQCEPRGQAPECADPLPDAERFVRAMTAETFASLNPELIRAIAESRGETLINGLVNLLKELSAAGPDVVAGSVARERGLAGTPGKVVFRNAGFEVIQFNPRTPRVARRPLLFVPGWVQKYYLLDLRSETSLIRWLADRGRTVFVVSWAAPDRAVPGDVEHIALDALPTALQVVESATGETVVDAAGIGLGGTVLALAAASLAAAGRRPIGSLSLLNPILDCSEGGALTTLLSEALALRVPAEVEDQPPRRNLSQAISQLGAIDLMWSFVLNNFLLGRDPLPTDLLAWNADITASPEAICQFWLRLLRHNPLASAQGVILGDRAVHLSGVTAPAYVLAARENHLSPWRSVYAGARRLGGPVRFTLTASGHAQSLINPPAARKYCYWTNANLPTCTNAWLAAARAREGSWWTDWADWLATQSDEAPPVTAREPGSGDLRPVGDAPGRFIHGDPDRK